MAGEVKNDVFRKAGTFFQNALEFACSTEEQDVDGILGCRDWRCCTDGHDDGVSGYSGTNGARIALLWRQYDFRAVGRQDLSGGADGVGSLETDS